MSDRETSPPGTGARAREGTVEVATLLLRPTDRQPVWTALTEAGYRVVVPTGLRAWVAAQRPPAMLVVDDSERTLALVAAATEASPEAACVVLAHEPTPARYAFLLTRSAAVLPVTSSPADVVLALDAAWRRLACLPLPAARTLAGGPTGERPTLSDRETAWLRALADGATVAGLARAAGYSEREMYRLLAAVYGRLGADTRTEALLRADRWGLLRPPAADPVAASADAPARSGLPPRRWP